MYTHLTMDNVLKTAIKDTLLELGFPEVDFVVEHPAELVHGDYACNVALVLSKAAGRAPRHIAIELAAALAGQIEYVEKIEIAGPGFLNFYLSRDFFALEIERVGTLGEEWGKNSLMEG